MIVTIDGPAGAGKSSVSRSLAQRIGFQYLDTGAMYRALTWYVQQQQVDLTDQTVVANLANRLEMRFDGGRVLANGKDVSQEIRGALVTESVSEIADNPAVRQIMVSLQREIAELGNYVCEGRDQGTVAFPDAECKIFLTASPSERARRRYLQLLENGKSADLNQILASQTARDHRDQTRSVGKLVKASDAIEVLTDGKPFEEVLDELVAIVKARLAR